MALRDGTFHLFSARQLVQGLQAGQWSSEDLTRSFRERIRFQNPQLHAVHTLNEQAIEQARAIDARRARGESLGPLAGLPMTLKDAYACRGLRSTYGTALYAYNRPRKDCRVVAALRAADAVFLGRSAVPTASFDWNCRNQVFAECHNPLDSRRTPGGSSGGAAAALATGLTPLELGSDVGGSIRYPAHCCGVWGLRTSDGWLPFGDTGPSPKGFDNFAVAGPLARELDDLILLTEILAEAFPDKRLWAPDEAPAKPRIAYSYELAGLSPDSETRTLMDSWLDKLRSCGVELVEASPELDFAALLQDWCLLVGYELAQSLPPAPTPLKQAIMDAMVFKRLGPGKLPPTLRQGMGLSKSAYLTLLARYRSAQNQTDVFFQNHDAWALPISPTAAVKLSDCGTMMQTHLGEIPYADFLAGYLCPPVLMGTPALAAPIGTTATGLPIGLQIHGPRFGDRALLAMMEKLAV